MACLSLADQINSLDDLSSLSQSYNSAFADYYDESNIDADAGVDSTAPASEGPVQQRLETGPICPESSRWIFLFCLFVFLNYSQPL